jgi:hypothetical protein
MRDGIDRVSPGIRAILAQQPSAPTVQAECVRCGAFEDVRMGVYRDASGNHQSGRFCIDHDACRRRRSEP